MAVARTPKQLHFHDDHTQAIIVTMAMQSHLEVGFGRQLHVPLQVGLAPNGGHDSLVPCSSDKAVQESYNQAGTPAAFFDFKQLCGQQVNMLHLCNGGSCTISSWICKYACIQPVCVLHCMACMCGKVAAS